MRFTKTDSGLRYYRVREGVGATWGHLEEDQLLELHGDVPAALAELERAGIVSALPDPGSLVEWFRPSLRRVDASTFRTHPAERPIEPTISEADVCKRLGWSVEELRRAQAQLKFPPRASRRETFDERTGNITGENRFFWSAVEQWQRDVPAHLVPR